MLKAVLRHFHNTSCWMQLLNGIQKLNSRCSTQILASNIPMHTDTHTHPYICKQIWEYFFMNRENKWQTVLNSVYNVCCILQSRLKNKTYIVVWLKEPDNIGVFVYRIQNTKIINIKFSSFYSNIKLCCSLRIEHHGLFIRCLFAIILEFCNNLLCAEI